MPVPQLMWEQHSQIPSWNVEFDFDIFQQLLWEYRISKFQVGMLNLTWQIIFPHLLWESYLENYFTWHHSHYRYGNVIPTGVVEMVFFCEWYSHIFWGNAISWSNLPGSFSTNHLGIGKNVYIQGKFPKMHSSPGIILPMQYQSCNVSI